MKMNMAMPSTISAGNHAFHMPPMGSQASVPAMDMSGMASTFSTSTRVTLWFTEWTTTTTTTYVLTVFFLLLLGIFNRFLGALKSQLEVKWKMQHNSQHIPEQWIHADKSVRRRSQGHTRQWSRAFRPQPLRLDEPDQEETEPLSPTPKLQHVEEKGVERDLGASRKFWVANAPWSAKRDGIRASLEFTRAMVGYILSVIFQKPGIEYAETNNV
jgi:hypothetical protein